MTYLVGGMSVEKRSISVSASKTAFIPRELSTCLQNLQDRMDTHRSLKLQLLIDMASREGCGVGVLKMGPRARPFLGGFPRATNKMARPRAFLSPKIGKEKSFFLVFPWEGKVIFIEQEQESSSNSGFPFNFPGRRGGGGEV